MYWKTIVIATCFSPLIQCSDNANDVQLPRYLRNYRRRANGVPVNGGVDGAGPTVPEAFVSFSIEFSSFPDFAGNLSKPNKYSNTLLDNLAVLQGSKPIIRVGGNTQDFALFDENLEVGINGTYTSGSPDYPTIISIGPAYFESYQTWPDVKFIHGFNLGKNAAEDQASTLKSVSYACREIGSTRLLYWELGNEPDLYVNRIRPKDWDEADYSAEWLNLTRSFREEVKKACPNLANRERYKYIAPSFAGLTNSLNYEETVSSISVDNDIGLISGHNYIDGARNPGITLQGTLMNHTRVRLSADAQIGVAESLKEYNIPFILGEHNSLYNQGAPRLSDAFGAALWGIDFNLYIASKGIKRSHMHMGTNYRYAAWQPLTTEKEVIATKPPYYGNIAVAASLGDLTASDVKVRNIEMPSEKEAAYAIYNDGILKRIMVINMDAYNYTTDGDNTERPDTTYTFNLPTACSGDSTVQRLIANGSDAITGVTFNGYSYNYELDMGKPSLLKNVTTNEDFTVRDDGTVNVVLPHSSAALIQLNCGPKNLTQRAS